jgi:hypothetical protein
VLLLNHRHSFPSLSSTVSATASLKCSQNASVSLSCPFSLLPISCFVTHSEISAVDDKDNVWSYCPSVPAAIVLFALFGCTTVVHLIQAIKYRKAFCWVIIMGGLWETLSFISRVLSAHEPTKQGIYDASFLLLIISPLLINAFDYMLLGRMVTFHLPDNKLAGIKGSMMGVIFVCCDIM